MARKSPATSTTPTKKTPRAKAGRTTARVLEMRREAFRLANEGLSCPRIGEILGVTRERAWQLLNEEMDAVKAETREAALEWRYMLTARHNARLAALHDVIATAGSKDPGLVVAALDKARAIDVELGKLWGAYAPAKSELSGPDGSPLQVQSAFAVPLTTPDAASWTAAALTQSAGEEAEAERVLGSTSTSPRGADETPPTA